MLHLHHACVIFILFYFIYEHSVHYSSKITFLLRYKKITYGLRYKMLTTFCERKLQMKFLDCQNQIFNTKQRKCWRVKINPCHLSNARCFCVV